MDYYRKVENRVGDTYLLIYCVSFHLSRQIELETELETYLYLYLPASKINRGQAYERSIYPKHPCTYFKGKQNPSQVTTCVGYSDKLLLQIKAD